MDITITQDGADDDLEIVLKLKGRPDDVIKALCKGLPRPALEQLRDRLTEEVEKRRAK